MKTFKEKWNATNARIQFTISSYEPLMKKKNKHIDTQYTEYLTFIVFSFQDKVNAAKVSGNLDAPEGGFDAIMQAIACEVCDILYVKYTDNCCTVMELFFVTVNQLLFAMTLFHDLLVKNLFTLI